MSVGFSDPRVQIHIQDGAKFMEDHKGRFDVIITDSSDPVGEGWFVVEMFALLSILILHSFSPSFEGPAKCLFEIPYYRRMKSALKPNGIICTQGKSAFLHRPRRHNGSRLLHMAPSIPVYEPINQTQ